MNINTQMKSATVVPSPVNVKKLVTGAAELAADEQNQGIQYAELWKVIRGVLLVWAVAVWLLLVMMPGMQQISDAATAMVHLPHVFIGLGLIGAIFASYSLRSDIHMMWFLGVLLLLAGWM